MSYTYLLVIAVILISTKMLGLLTGKMHMPQVVGALLAGLLLGPACLGWLQPNEFLVMLAELGVIVIMFSAGMETSINDLKQSGKAGFLVAMLGVSVPLISGAVLAWFFNKDGNMLENIFIGVVLTATSVSITVEALKEMGKLSTKVGNTILAAALIDDVLGLVCLTIVTSLTGENVNIFIVLLKIVLFFVFASVIGYVYIKLSNWFQQKDGGKNLHRYPVLAFALCLFMAWSAEVWFGVADIIGAFAAGLIISTTPKGKYIEGKFSPLSYILLTPIFFANIGIEIELPAMDLQLILFTVMLVAVGVLSKLIGCGFGGKMCKFTTKQSVQIGLGMACRGEVALIAANKGMSLGVLPEKFFGPIVILVIFCAVITPILLKIAFRGEETYEGMQESSLVDNYQIAENISIITDKLLQTEANRTNDKNSN